MERKYSVDTDMVVCIMSIPINLSRSQNLKKINFFSKPNQLALPATYLRHKTGYPVTGGATFAVSVSFISKLACYIKKCCKKKAKKLQRHDIYKKWNRFPQKESLVLRKNS